MNPQAENVFVARMTAALAPSGFDPASLIAMLVQFLTEALQGCFEKNPLPPAQVVDRVKTMTMFEQMAMTSRFSRFLRSQGMKDSRAAATAAQKALRSVADDSTPEEQIAFAEYVAPMASDDFDIF